MTYPVLYILMRTDLASMNPGKAIAQGAHASNQFMYEAIGTKNPVVKRLYKDWLEQGGKFGTTIVLDCESDYKIRILLDSLKENASDYISGIVLDSTYPVLDGKTMHHIPVYTCGYIFGHKDNASIQDILKKYPLYK